MKSESAELVSGLIRQYRRLRLLYLVIFYKFLGF